MIEPLRLTLRVARPIEHAFDVWTRKSDRWWPSDHTVTGRGDVRVVLEPWLGGRIFERTPEEAEHEWGEVTLWDPPHRLGYIWHLRRDRADATNVLIGFMAEEACTRIEIEHLGWDPAGGGGPGVARPQPAGLDHATAALRRRPRPATGSVTDATMREETHASRHQGGPVGAQDGPRDLHIHHVG